jgi:cyclic-di-AMP phosphodiesterase PgpH
MRLRTWLQQHAPILYKLFIFLVAILIIVQLFPKMPRFGYDYQMGSPWKYEDLIAPVDFAIHKSQEELDREKEWLLKEFKPFFSVDDSIIDRQQRYFSTAFNDVIDEMPAGLSRSFNHQRVFLLGTHLLDSIFHRGIIFLDNTFINEPGDFAIRLIEGRVATERKIQDFFSISSASLYIEKQTDHLDAQIMRMLRGLLQNSLVHNVYYDEALTKRVRETELQAITPTQGMVQQGEKIISRGEIVSIEKAKIIESYKLAYMKIAGELSGRYVLYAGQFLLVSISMVVLILFLFVFRKDVFANNRRIFLILLTIIIMMSLTSFVLRYNVNFLYLIPVCIVPVVIRAFFDNRLALYVHINTIILIGFLIPRSFEFVFLQFIAGIIAILSMVSLRRRSQLFSTVVLIFVTYAAVYIGLSLAHGGNWSALVWIDFLYFSIAAILTLFAYPLIFLFERLFGMPTDFSLLELSDTNNPLLRKLAMVAPGTFQHSMQVANLAEEAIFSIGGNALLTRTGALYHDIGKMESAMFFTENQTSGYNPHDEISYKESANIIIDHVINGIEMARKNNLPEYIIDFIRTHHGTTTARYFYTMYLKDNPGNIADMGDFVYPGPKPFSKETAIVMMADSVEAASRSLGKSDEDQISKLVDRIIDRQIEENQFERAPITFSDITRIKKIFKDRLLNIYHVRIAYPVLS